MPCDRKMPKKVKNAFSFACGGLLSLLQIDSKLNLLSIGIIFKDVLYCMGLWWLTSCGLSFSAQVNSTFNQLVNMIIKLVKLQEAFTVFLEHRSLTNFAAPAAGCPMFADSTYCLFVFLSYLGLKQELYSNEAYKFCYACGGLFAHFFCKNIYLHTC